MKIGDEVYVHGYVDEIRKDIVIIRNKGGYFGTDASEVILADRKIEPNSSEKPNNSLDKDTNVRSKPNNCELQTIRCPKCGRTDYIRDMEKDMGIKGSCYEYKCINCNTYIKDELQTGRSE